MDVKIDVNPEDVKAALTKAIVDGAMGKEIEKAMLSMREYNGSRFCTALESVVKGEIENIIREEVRKKYEGELREKVKEKLTTGLMDELIEKSLKGLRGW
jgi:hypothetical protein